MFDLSMRGLASVVLLFILAFAVTFGSRYSRLYNNEAITATENDSLLVYERIGLEELYQKLDSANVVFDRAELTWAASLLGWRNFRSGRYEINGQISYQKLLSNMARGIQDPLNVVVHGGLDIPRLSQRLARQMKADSASFSDQFTDSSEVALELGLTGEKLFGRMLPDTYQLYWTRSAENTVRRIYDEFNSRIAESMAEEIEKSPFSLNEIVTLASIVEMESRHAEEKPTVSGLYINRLNRNMYLQADPTVLYAMGERRRLLFEDYKFDHPYNTYINPGLPPGPITNPDHASIRAVL